MPNCSGNGVCALGECVCYKGFKGTDCSIPDKLNITHLCTKNCSGHGIYNVEDGKCECERFFTGKDCDTGNWNGLFVFWNTFVIIPHAFEITCQTFKTYLHNNTLLRTWHAENDVKVRDKLFYHSR